MIEEKAKSSTIWKVLIIIGIIFGVFAFVIPSIAYNSDSYVGEFIMANRVYMNDGSINLVIYFNESSDSTHYLIFEAWEASHSVTLSNLDAGDNIKVSYCDYVFGVRTITEIEKV